MYERSRNIRYANAQKIDGSNFIILTVFYQSFYSLIIKNIDTSMFINRVFKALGRACILGLVITGPWRNGGSEPAYLQFFLYLIISSGVFALLTLWTTPRYERQKFSHFPTVIVSIPLILGLLLCYLQIVPFSENVIAKLSPHITTLKRTLLPYDLNLSIDDLPSSDNDSELRAVLDENKSYELNREFLSSVFPWDEVKEFDIDRALILDQAIENEFLSGEEKERLSHWGSTISVYPLATRSGIPLFWGATILLFASSVLFNSTESRRFLFKVIIFTGVSFALLCVLKKANPSLMHSGFLRRIWGRYLLDGQYGTYVNKNSAGGYLVLIFATSLFFSIYEFTKSAFWVSKERKERRVEQAQIKKNNVYEIESESLWKILLGDLFDLFNRRLIFWLFISTFFFSTIFISLSRGAAIAASSAALFVCAVILCKKQTRRYWFVIAFAILLVLVIVLATSMYEQVDSRMSTLIDDDDIVVSAIQRDSRWDNWRSALKSSQDYLWFGSGLGTYSIANWSNDAAVKSNLLFYYAENVFIQTRLEMGLIGLILLILSYLILFCIVGRYLFGRRSFEAFSLSAGGVALVTGQLVAACGDFGNYLPANLLLFVILSGAILGRKNLKKWDELTASMGDRRTVGKAVGLVEKLKKRERIGLVVVSVLLLGCLSGVVWNFTENSDSIERWALQRQLNLPSKDFLYMTDTSLNGVIEGYEKYIAYRDDSYEIRQGLASLRILQFRLRGLEGLKSKYPNSTPEKLWEGTSTNVFLDTLLKYQSIDFNVPVNGLRERNMVIDFLKPALRDELAARRICPLYTYLNRGIICKIPLATNASWEEERLLAELYSRRISAFNPNSPSEMSKNGTMLGYFKLGELQKQFLRRTLQLSSLYSEDVLSVLGVSFPGSKINEAVDEVIPDSTSIAFKVFEKAMKLPQDSSIRKAVISKTINVFDEVPDDLRNGTYYYQLAKINESLEKYDDLDACLVKAIEIEPNNPAFSLRRARMLMKYRKKYDKDEECLQLLQDLRPKLRGRYRLDCDSLLEDAEKNFLDSQARKKAQEKIRRERETDERIRRPVPESSNESIEAAEENEKPSSTD